VEQKRAYQSHNRKIAREERRMEGTRKQACVLYALVLSPSPLFGWLSFHVFYQEEGISVCSCFLMNTTNQKRRKELRLYVGLVFREAREGKWQERNAVIDPRKTLFRCV